MSKGIKISPKYGLNPTIPVCFWCGKQKNEIALMGRMSKKHERRNAWGGTSTEVESDIEAPKNMVLDYVPCEECQNHMNMGVAILEASDHPNTENQPPMQKGVYPTSRFVVVTTECADRVFDQYAPWQAGKKVFVDSAVFSHFLPDYPSPDPAE